MLVVYLIFGAAQAQDETDASAEVSNTLTFDERLVRGQVAAGSVYLFQRKPRALPGLVPVRRSYRAEIVEPLLGDRSQKAKTTK